MINQSTAIKQGEIDAFGSFFRIHYNRLLMYCKLFIKDEIQAEDVVQETFIHFWEKRENIDPSKPLESLLFISLRNRCLNHLRGQKTENLKLINYKSEIQSFQFITHIDYLGHEEFPLEDQLINELQSAIELLPTRCRDVLKLAKIDGFKNREVAVKLGISTKAVEKQLSIAKIKLEDHMKKKYPLGIIFISYWLS